MEDATNKEPVEELEDEVGAEEGVEEEENLRTVKVSMVLSLDAGVVLDQLKDYIFDDLDDIKEVLSFEIEEIKE